MGAGLLAMAVVQPMNLLTDTPLSRASPLPHKPAPTKTYSHRRQLPQIACPHWNAQAGSAG
ncbi:hypothetical protein F0169_26305 [Pseudomonas sp. MAFF 212408]|uniref:Uncharacterized protein n=1 Tax=Pseudomonas kitaguniensis TaxID=2607908 RepID=A0A5N7KSU9_9PSED|nr:hypothetical protein [Pseudomonas kitaguniensis]